MHAAPMWEVPFSFVWFMMGFLLFVGGFLRCITPFPVVIVFCRQGNSAGGLLARSNICATAWYRLLRPLNAELKDLGEKEKS